MSKNKEMRNSLRVTDLVRGSIVCIFGQDEDGEFTQRFAMEPKANESMSLDYNDKLVGKEVMVRVLDLSKDSCKEKKVTLEKHSTILKFN